MSGSDGNGSASNGGDLGLIPGSRRSPGGGHGNPLQYSCLENPLDRGAWRVTVHGSQRVGVSIHKKDLHDPDNHNGVITHLEPDILECEVKWAIGSITMNKASGGDGIPVELFQILKDDAVKVLHSVCQKTWKTQQWPQDWKRSVFIPIPKKGNAKENSNYCTVALISHWQNNAQNSPNKASTVHEL